MKSLKTFALLTVSILALHTVAWADSVSGPSDPIDLNNGTALDLLSGGVGAFSATTVGPPTYIYDYPSLDLDLSTFGFINNGDATDNIQWMVNSLISGVGGGDFNFNPSASHSPGLSITTDLSLIINTVNTQGATGGAPFSGGAVSLTSTGVGGLVTMTGSDGGYSIQADGYGGNSGQGGAVAVSAVGAVTLAGGISTDKTAPITVTSTGGGAVSIGGLLDSSGRYQGGAVTVTSDASGGTVALTSVDTNGSFSARGGAIVVSADGDVVLTGGTTSNASESNPGGSTSITSISGAVSIGSLDGYSIDANGNGSSSNNGGTVTVSALGAITASNAIRTDGTAPVTITSTGGGLITLSGDVQSWGRNEGGIVTITSNTTGGSIAATNVLSRGDRGQDGGAVVLGAAGDVVLTGGINTNSYIGSGSSATGGAVDITSSGGAVSIGLLDGYSIQSKGNGNPGGAITIRAPGAITTSGKVHSGGVAAVNITSTGGGAVSIGDTVGSTGWHQGGRVTVMSTAAGGSLSLTNVNASGSTGDKGGAVALGAAGNVVLSGGINSKGHSSNAGGAVGITSSGGAVSIGSLGGYSIQASGVGSSTYSGGAITVSALGAITASDDIHTDGTAAVTITSTGGGAIFVNGEVSSHGRRKGGTVTVMSNAAGGSITLGSVDTSGERGEAGGVVVLGAYGGVTLDGGINSSGFPDTAVGADVSVSSAGTGAPAVYIGGLVDATGTTAADMTVRSTGDIFLTGGLDHGLVANAHVLPGWNGSTGSPSYSGSGRVIINGLITGAFGATDSLQGDVYFDKFDNAVINDGDTAQGSYVYREMKTYEGGAWSGGAPTSGQAALIERGQTYTSTAPQAFTEMFVAPGATLGGTAMLTGNVTIYNDATVAPGASVGTLSQTGNQTWNGAGVYQVEFDDVVSGPGTGWDMIDIDGILNITATSANPFVIEMAALVDLDFDNQNEYSFEILHTTGGIVGFDEGSFVLDTSGFGEYLGGGEFTLVALDNSLFINIPEPATMTLLALGGLALIRRKRNK